MSLTLLGHQGCLRDHSRGEVPASYTKRPQTVVLPEIFLAFLLHWPFLPLLSTAASCCCQGDLPALTLLPFFISCFRPGHWVTKLSGAECRSESPGVSPVKEALVDGSFGTSFGWLDTSFVFLLISSRVKVAKFQIG